MQSSCPSSLVPTSSMTAVQEAIAPPIASVSYSKLLPDPHDHLLVELPALRHPAVGIGTLVGAALELELHAVVVVRHRSRRMRTLSEPFPDRRR